MHQVTPCKARKRNGDPCGNAAMNGSVVCRMHGGAAPQVKRAAQMRILQASDQAAARLVAMMQDQTVPPAVQLAAARDLLDRAGLVGKQELDVVEVTSKWDDLMDEIVIEVDVEEDDDHFDANVVDAEIVYDDDDDNADDADDDDEATVDEAAADAAHDAAMEARQAARDRAKRRTGNSVPVTASRAETDDPGEGTLYPPQPGRAARAPRPQARRKRRHPGLG